MTESSNLKKRDKKFIYTAPSLDSRTIPITPLALYCTKNGIRITESRRVIEALFNLQPPVSARQIATATNLPVKHVINCLGDLLKTKRIEIVKNAACNTTGRNVNFYASIS